MTTNTMNSNNNTTNNNNTTKEDKKFKFINKRNNEKYYIDFIKKNEENWEKFSFMSSVMDRVYLIDFINTIENEKLGLQSWFRNLKWENTSAYMKDEKMKKLTYNIEYMKEHSGTTMSFATRRVKQYYDMGFDEFRKYYVTKVEKKSEKEYFDVYE